MSDYTPRNPEAYYGHPLAREIAVAARNGRYVTLEGSFDIGRVVEEVIESEWLAERDRQMLERGYDEGRSAEELAWMHSMDGHPVPEGEVCDECSTENPYRKEHDYES